MTEDDNYPYCAKHGHGFDQEQGCVECVAAAMAECDARIAAKAEAEWIEATEHPSYFRSEA